MRVMIIVGTRPEIIRLSRVITVLDENLDLCLVHTGQNYDYELNQIFFDDLKIRKPDIFLNSVGSSPVETIANIIFKMDAVLLDVKPDAVLILGDTNSCLSSIAAKKHKIPIFHMEAGNRCYDDRVPEEVNRKIIDHIADINLTYSNISREYLLKEGLPPDRVIKIGSPMKEVLDYYRDDIGRSDVLEKCGLEEGKYFVFSVHREENVDNDRNFRNILSAANKLTEIYNYPIFFSTHPRTSRRICDIGFVLKSAIMARPVGFFDYVKLQLGAFMVLSDSGTITEESSILGFPALNVRETHERPEGMEEAAVILTGTNVDDIVECVKIAKSKTKSKIVDDYNVEDVSGKVLRIMASYTRYVNRVVWKK